MDMRGNSYPLDDTHALMLDFDEKDNGNVYPTITLVNYKTDGTDQEHHSCPKPLLKEEIESLLDFEACVWDKMQTHARLSQAHFHKNREQRALCKLCTFFRTGPIQSNTIVCDFERNPQAALKSLDAMMQAAYKWGHTSEIRIRVINSRTLKPKSPWYLEKTDAKG